MSETFTLWSYKFLFCINYALGATKDKDNDFVNLINLAGDAAVQSC